MKCRFLLILTSILFLGSRSYSQTKVTTSTLPDSLVSNVDILDSAYLGTNIFDILGHRSYAGGEVLLLQSHLVKDAVNNYIASASKRRIPGFRIRIFFDNKQNARGSSEEVVNSFKEKYPGIGVYRTYDNPYFKVTVGDLRTKSDAEWLLRQLAIDYPAAFIVKENINFPPL
jgi:hypothetical protein